MNKRAFTLIELLAVLVVLSIATMIATPNVMKTVDSSRKEKFIIDAREIVLRSTYMYNEEEYRNNDNFFILFPVFYGTFFQSCRHTS